MDNAYFGTSTHLTHSDWRKFASNDSSVRMNDFSCIKEVFASFVGKDGNLPNYFDEYTADDVVFSSQ